MNSCPGNFTIILSFRKSVEDAQSDTEGKKKAYLRLYDQAGNFGEGEIHQCR
ncbi:MAG: hypothetical protein Ct9H300mP28_34640 [Pseudomonadota bacterium]|nr:MAG: hypothetical protein Ct9H300mP28_34640 [Pseudomonadota bacterium]